MSSSALADTIICASWASHLSGTHANQLDVLEYGWRYATEAEIQANKALNDPLGNGTTLNAAITNEQIARANGDNALSTSITTLQSVAGDYLTKNAKFAAWDIASNPPNKWVNFTSDAGTSFQRVAGKYSPYAMQINIVPNINGNITHSKSTGLDSPWVQAGTPLIVDIVVESATSVNWLNWGVFLQMHDAGGGQIAGSNNDKYWYLGEAANKDTNGINYSTDSAGVVRTYSFQFIPGVSGYACLWAFGGWSYTVASAQSVIFHKVGLRTNSYAEGQVAITAASLASLDGRVSALYGIELVAGTSKARFKGLASGGTNPTSSWLMEADTIMLGGDVKVYTGPGANVAHRVASQPNEYTGTHGQTIQYGGTYNGKLPKVEAIPNMNLPALSAGSSYDIRPISITDTQFVVRAVTVTQGANTLRTSPASSAVGDTTPGETPSSPRHQTTKPQDGSTALDAIDNIYTFIIDGTAPVTHTDLLYSNLYAVDWQADFSLYYKPAGGNWVKIYTGLYENSEVVFGNGNWSPQAFTINLTANFNPVGNTGSAYCFGVHPLYSAAEVSGFTTKYNTATQSNEQAVTGNFTFKVTAPTY